MNTLQPWPLLLGTGLMLGLGAPLARAAAMHGVGPLAFAMWPTALAALVMAALGAWRHGLPVQRYRLARFGVVAGLLGHALPMTALFWLSSHAGAGFASLSLVLPPVFTLVIALAVGRERALRGRVLAVGLGFFGALLMLSGRGGSYEATPLVIAIALAIPASIGAGNVYRAMRLPAGVSGEWLSAATLLASSSVLAGVRLSRSSLEVPLQPLALAWLALQSLSLVVGYLLYFALQRRADPVTFSFIGYVMMSTGVLAGLLFFGERLSWTVWPAMGLVLTALVLIARLPATPRTPDLRTLGSTSA
jgi:drug/metabolite transporter (DMT)-like permease